MKTFEALFVKFLIKEYFDGDINKLVANSHYAKHQIDSWSRGNRKPRLATLRWLMSTTVAPEFKVAKEFEPVNISNGKDVMKELKRVLGNHAENNGVYAFYDSMCNVVYVGKASSGFLTEMYQQIRANLGVPFPKAITKAPKLRWHVVSYVSAYEIPHVDHLDYPRHVEALVLRLSKPIGNKILGRLNFSSKPDEPSLPLKKSK